jgi:hypothetical protein
VTGVDPAGQRVTKARLIARHLWLHDLTVADMRRLPYTSRDQPSASKFARAAFRASDDPHLRALAPPHSPDSATWSLVEQYLTERAEWEAGGGTPLPRDLAGFAHLWHVTDDGPVPLGPPEQPEAPPTTVTDTPVPDGDPVPDVDQARAELALLDPDVVPPGWDQLAHLAPLTYGQCINHPGRRPVVITPDGGRCAACPPRPREFQVHRSTLHQVGGRRTVVEEDYASRDGWGCRRVSRPGGPQSLDWSPRAHQPGVRHCGCGRCPTPTSPQEREQSESTWPAGPALDRAGQCPPGNADRGPDPQRKVPSGLGDPERIDPP